MGEYLVGGRRLPTSEVVVITGMGMATPIGKNVSENWRNVTEGRTGVARIVAEPNYEQLEHDGLPVQIVGQVKDFTYSQYLSRIKADDKNIRRGRPRVVQLAVEAAGQTAEDAGIADILETGNHKVGGEFYPFQRIALRRGVIPTQVGVAFGTSAGGSLESARHYRIMRERGLDKVSPYAANDTIPDTGAGAISMTLGLQGPYEQIGTACESGLEAVVQAIKTLRSDRLDSQGLNRRIGVKTVLAVAAEGVVTPIGMASFIRNTALTDKYNDTPEVASRPFDRDRDGFVIAEAAAGVTVEFLDDALERGARIYGVVAGYGASRDRNVSLTAPDLIGGPRAMHEALVRARLTGKDVSYVNAHAPSTGFDLQELRSIRRIFGRDVMVSSTKGQTGHLVGAAGLAEIIYCLMALQEGNSAPPGINFFNHDPKFPDTHDANYVTTYDPSKKLYRVASNSFAFGGRNGTIILESYDKGNLTEV